MRLALICLVFACDGGKSSPPKPAPSSPAVAVPTGPRIPPDAADVMCENCGPDCKTGDDAACRGYRRYVHEANYPDREDNLEIAEAGCMAKSPIACELGADIAYRVEDSYERAAAYLERACELGGGGGCWLLANWLVDGRGVAQDRERAQNLWQRGCEQGFMRACATLGLHLVNAGKFADAATWYQKACDGKYEGACYEVGLLYADGRGVTPDRKRALDLLAHDCTGHNYTLACDAYREVTVRKDPLESIVVRGFLIGHDKAVSRAKRSKTEAKKLADEAIRALASGTGFEVVRTKYGDASDAESKPDTLYRHVRDYDGDAEQQAFEDKLFALKPGTALARDDYPGFIVFYRER